MRMILLCALIVCVLVSTAVALERQSYQMREDFGAEPLYDCTLNYYYYIPCPTYSWFWAFTGWTPGDVIGQWFEMGDLGTGTSGPCDPAQCHTLEQIRVLDFAGYGTVHPGLFTIEFDVFCADQYGCPVGPSLWNSGPKETAFAWNYLAVDPPLCITACAVDPGPPPTAPRILVTATHTGPCGIYPAWGMDNISTAVEQGCIMHDQGCLPALYPRPYVSHWSIMRSGFYGANFEYCPPQWFMDGRDTTPDGSQYGFIELTWRLYIVCSGPTGTQPTTWGDIKSIYR
jgi:hypothetical protein